MLEIKSGQDLMLIKSLWEAMNRHNMIHSRHFQDDFQENSFEDFVKIYETVNDYRLEIIYQNSSPYGYILGHINNNKALIDSFYLYDDLRGMGLGEYLLNRMILWFRSCGVQEIVLEIEAGNENMISYCHKMGFFMSKYVMKLNGEKR